MKRVWIFLGLKWGEVLDVLCWIVVMALGFFVIVVVFFSVLSFWFFVADNENITILLSLLTFLIPFSIFIFKEDIKDWLKSNWQKAGEIAEGKK